MNIYETVKIKNNNNRQVSTDGEIRQERQISLSQRF